MRLQDVIIGVDTAAGVAAAAIVRGADGADGTGRGVAATGRQALEGLLSCVRRALAAADREMRDVGAIAVCSGPGSFTGLRIGVTFAKSLAQALACAAIGVSSFDIISSLRSAAEGATPRIAVAEGKRGFYYARFIVTHDGPPLTVAGSRDFLVTAARDAFGEDGERDLTRAFDAPPPDAGARAATAAALGRRSLDAGAPGDWRRLAIEYGQRPNAVVNWELRHGRL